MFCSKCGTETKDGTVFCPKCGSKLDSRHADTPSHATFCPKCGNELRDGQEFCSKCGHALDARHEQSKLPNTDKIKKNVTEAVASVAEATKKTSTKSPLLLPIAAAVVIVVIVVGVFVLRPSKPSNQQSPNGGTSTTKSEGTTSQASGEPIDMQKVIEEQGIAEKYPYRDYIEKLRDKYYLLTDEEIYSAATPELYSDIIACRAYDAMYKQQKQRSSEEATKQIEADEKKITDALDELFNKRWSEIEKNTVEVKKYEEGSFLTGEEKKDQFHTYSGFNVEIEVKNTLKVPVDTLTLVQSIEGEVTYRNKYGESKTEAFVQEYDKDDDGPLAIVRVKVVPQKAGASCYSDDDKLTVQDLLPDESRTIKYQLILTNDLLLPAGSSDGNEIKVSINKLKVAPSKIEIMPARLSNEKTQDITVEGGVCLDPDYNTYSLLHSGLDVKIGDPIEKENSFVAKCSVTNKTNLYFSDISIELLAEREGEEAQITQNNTPPIAPGASMDVEFDIPKNEGGDSGKKPDNKKPKDLVLYSARGTIDVAENQKNGILPDDWSKRSREYKVKQENAKALVMAFESMASSFMDFANKHPEEAKQMVEAGFSACVNGVFNAVEKSYQEEAEAMRRSHPVQVRIVD